TATFSYTNTVGQSGNVVLGDILSNDPDTSKTSYGVKQLITMSSITVNGAAFTGVTAPAFHLNTYFGDVSGDGAIGAADVNPMFSVSINTASGFGPYSLTDPGVVADIDGSA